VVVLASALGLSFSLSFRAEANTRAADVEAAAAGLLARANDARIVAAPRSDALRKVLAEDALRFYDRFLRERPTEPRLREGRARALWTLSQVHWLVGEYAASEAVAREAASEAEALVAADADHLEYRAILGNALRNLGKALSGTGQRDAARAAFDRSVRELELCYSKAPAKYADLLVRALLEWGTTLNATELETCARTLRRAIAIQEETVRERPALAATVDLLEALAAAGQVLTTLGELPEATRLLRRADDLLEKTPDAGPAYECRVLASGATLAGRKGNHQAAIARLKRAIETARRWSEREPTWQRPWGELLDLHVALAQQCRASATSRPPSRRAAPRSRSARRGPRGSPTIPSRAASSPTTSRLRDGPVERRPARRAGRGRAMDAPRARAARHAPPRRSTSACAHARAGCTCPTSA
jgi:tetratricopeptide (TPR) repeat protein